MSKIYDLTPSYRAGRRYVNFAFKRYYSKFIVLGRENIPTEGPVIFAPNHLNALMDALVLLASTPYSLSNVYIARSDIFKKGFFSKALRFLKILPAFRIRDGYENLGKNDATFDEAREVLEQRNALCVMAEGNQGDQRRLRPFVKGIFRIAFTAQEQMGDRESIRMIPVGLDYSNRVKFGAEVIASYGKPIFVSDYMKLYAENPAVAINALRDALRAALHEQSVDLASDTYYECFETAVYVADAKVAKSLFGKSNSASRFLARQRIADYLIAMEANDEEKISLLCALCKEYRQVRDKYRLTETTLESPWNYWQMVEAAVVLLATLPVAVAGGVLNVLPACLPQVIRKRMGVKYDGFFSSFDFVLGGIILFPLLYLLQTVVFALITPAPWWMVLLFIPVQYLAGQWAFAWWRTAKGFWNRFRFHCLRLSKYKEMDKLNRFRDKIKSLIEF